MRRLPFFIGKQYLKADHLSLTFWSKHFAYFFNKASKTNKDSSCKAKIASAAGMNELVTEENKVFIKKKDENT